MDELDLLTINSLINDKEYDKAFNEMVKIVGKGLSSEKTAIVFESFIAMTSKCIEGLQETENYVSIFKCFKSAIKLFPLKHKEIRDVSSIIKISFTKMIDGVEAILREKLPRKHWQKHFKQLSVQISVVALGAKRGFLWDVGPVQTLTNEITMEAIKEINKRLKGSLHLVTMNDEIFILNQKLVPINVTEHIFIDVSRGLKSPRLIESSEALNTVPSDLVQKLNRQFESNNIYSDPGLSIEIKVRTEDCVPCISGLLIGYPVIYFYDETSKGENCLQDVCLNVQQIELKDLALISFSVPSELLEGNYLIKNAIQHWKSVMLLVPELKLKCFNKNLNVVIL